MVQTSTSHLELQNNISFDRTTTQSNPKYFFVCCNKYSYKFKMNSSRVKVMKDKERQLVRLMEKSLIEVEKQSEFMSTEAHFNG